MSGRQGQSGLPGGDEAGGGMRGWWVVGLTAVTMLGLTVMQEPVGWSWVAWVALVPWVLAVTRAERGGWALVFSYLLGLGYFLGNLYWLVGVTAAGYAGLCFYLGWYWPVMGYVVRWAYRRGWPMVLVLPIVWVGQEYLRAVVFTGFPWLFLGHSQHEQVRLIQVCDLVGVYGVTFLIALVNGVVADSVLGRRDVKRQKVGRRKRGLIAAGAVTVSLLVGTLIYGELRLREGERTITAGPRVTVVQDNVPQYVKESGASGPEIFLRHLRLSEAGLAAGETDLMVWPETMCTMLNGDFLDLPLEGFPTVTHGTGDYRRLLEVLRAEELDEQQTRELLALLLPEGLPSGITGDMIDMFLRREVSRAQDVLLAELAGRGAAVLAGSSSVAWEWSKEAEKWRPRRKWNSAEFYRAGGERDEKRYDKMHLVPFGEVVPFRKSWPWLYRQLNRLTPYDYEYPLDAGEEATVFELAGEGGKVSRFAVAICYEDVMPQATRRLCVDNRDGKMVDFLLNISNDGWFVRGGRGEPIRATTELVQHWVICKFRAVENRVGIARAVNTGISGFIGPDGREQQAGLVGSLAHDVRERQTEAGFLTDRVMVDERVSVYSEIGDMPAVICAVGLGVMLVWGLGSGWWVRRSKRTRYTNCL